ncbi:acylphosphatase [uncultured Pontibacter sp.]|uniref:acylphosphatase n=1 Tax=uncultured Pontibacter sp. TaxID=453356 RepID=UPI002629374D|nr:acylphosphatase [uncultured Pontibacter sp.]
MAEQKKHVAIRVYGKVQGVFFRASTLDKAREFGLTGFVQNEDDGTVYLEAEGDEEALRKLEDWVHEGPKHARVTRVDVKTVKELEGFEYFEQRR